jgi:hypothetical protein
LKSTDSVSISLRRNDEYPRSDGVETASWRPRAENWSTAIPILAHALHVPEFHQGSLNETGVPSMFKNIVMDYVAT